MGFHEVSWCRQEPWGLPFPANMRCGWGGLLASKKNWVVVVSIIFLMFIPIPGEDSHIDYDFSNGLKRPTRKSIGKEMGEFWALLSCLVTNLAPPKNGAWNSMFSSVKLFLDCAVYMFFWCYVGPRRFGTHMKQQHFTAVHSLPWSLNFGWYTVIAFLRRWHNNINPWN